ncbi:uracil-DNA glycosylase family protein [Ahrensia sp. R2A130]|uniref:uracil-DNA glycosylase family protein n=1 Tax=Ahrensia sp. R2A130 TaxID=744979 RepID=UPI0001E0F07C|nr:uracil-DNA glycosylase family protein [Ahrensia sp. R2A130]EFL90438.1 uracil-DNA glycosylase [Ahrensia sp. R2A130]
MPEDLSALQTGIDACRICIERPAKLPLPHEPRPVAWLSSSARLCIAGQAPGLRVHKSGLPFDDASGNRLREWMGIDCDQFYDREKLAIVPMGFCFPGYDAKGSDLPPRRECRAVWHDDVFAAMPQIELIIVIGQYAQKYHLGSRMARNMTETARDWRTHLHSNEHRVVLPIPHPSWRNTAWLKRNPWFQNEVVPVLQAQVQRLML